MGGRTLSPEQQRLDREQEQWLADQLSKQVQQEKELAELRRLQELAEARALQQGGGLGSVGIWGAPSPAAATAPPGLAQPTAGLSEQDVWLQQMQSGTAAGTIPVGFGAGAGAGVGAGAPDPSHQQGGAADDEYGIGSLEDALAAYGLAHLWPSMRDEEMDVDAFLMLEYDDLEDLSGQFFERTSERFVRGRLRWEDGRRAMHACPIMCPKICSLRRLTAHHHLPYFSATPRPAGDARAD